MIQRHSTILAQPRFRWCVSNQIGKEMKTLLKSETKDWFEEVTADGVRRIRIETSTETHFSEDTEQKHNPTQCLNVEYI